MRVEIGTLFGNVQKFPANARELPAAAEKPAEIGGAFSANPIVVAAGVENFASTPYALPRGTKNLASSTRRLAANARAFPAIPLALPAIALNFANNATKFANTAPILSVTV